MNDLDLRSTHPQHPGRAQPDPAGLRSAAAALRLRHAPGHSQARETEPHQQRRARLGDHRPANALDPELENLRLEEVVRVVPEPEYEGSRLEMGHVGEAEASRQSRRIRQTRQLEGQQEGRSGERCEGEVRPVQRAICPYNPGLDLEIARAVWIQMDRPGSPGGDELEKTVPSTSIRSAFVAAAAAPGSTIQAPSKAASAKAARLARMAPPVASETSQHD